MLKTKIKEIENLYPQIQNIIKSLKITDSKMTYYINNDEEITDIFFDIRVNGKPDKIKYKEYKELTDFVKQNKINEIRFKADGMPYGASYDDPTYPLYEMVIKGKPLLCEKSLYSFVLYINYLDRQSFKYISSVNYIQELNYKHMEKVKDHIRDLEKIGYKSKIGNEEYIELLRSAGIDIEGFDKDKEPFNSIATEFLEMEVGKAFIYFESFEVERIKVNYTLNEKGFLNAVSDFIIYAKTNPENMTYKEFEIIQNRSMTLIYNNKEIMDYSLEPRDFRNVVFYSMDISPHKVVKSIKGTKGEGLRPIIKRLEKSGYTLDL